MSFQVTPDAVQAAAQSLANIHSTLDDANASVAAPTTGVVAAAEDQVSAGVAQFLSAFGRDYQAISAGAQSFHAQFVNQLNAGAGAYLGTEAANAEQALANQVTVPAWGLLAGAGDAAAPAASPIPGDLGVG